MHVLTVSVTCVMMILAPVIVVISGRHRVEEEME
jgi:hypothetical protein